jgi:type IV secretion system protein VirB9
MIRRLLLASAAVTALASPALAQIEPPVCPGGDTRVRCVAPGAHQIVLLRARPGASLVIELPAGERVLAVPVSDNTLMRGRAGGSAPEASVRFGEDEGTSVDGNLAVAVRGTAVVLKPFQPLSPQPFFILTEREGRQHRYAFELRADAPGPGAEAASPFYYSVRMRNVVAEEQERRDRAEAEMERRAQRLARDRLVQSNAEPCATIPNMNFRYVGQGDAALAPTQVCDDGRSTFMHLPANQRIPAVFTVLPDGREAAVNVSIGRDGWIMVHEHSPLLRLRDGGRVLCLINRGYDPRGWNSGTGTIAPDVVRSPAPTLGGLP